MILVLYPDKDAYITNRIISSEASASLSNTGLAGALALFHFSGTENLQQVAAIENSRILMDFDLTALNGMTDIGFTPVSATYTLEMMDAPVNEYLPGGFMVEVRRVSGSWAEGNGFDLQALSHLGAVNWLSSSTGNLWTAPGCDLTGSSELFFFSDGTENLSLDITSLVTASILNGDSNMGICVKLVDALESGAADVDHKVFYSKDSPNTLMWPRLIGGTTGDVTTDQRESIELGGTGSLVVVYSNNGDFTNIPGIATSSNVLAVELSSSLGYRLRTSGSFVKTGFYSASIELPLSKLLADNLATSGSLTFVDTWTRPSDDALVYADEFTVIQPIRDGVPLRNFKVSMMNLKPSYMQSETPMLKLFVQDQTRNAAPEMVPTPSVSAYISGLKYEVRSADNQALIVPASNFTLLSSHGEGSFFYFPMANLPEGRMFEFNFFYTEFGQTVKLNKHPFKFKVDVDVSRDGN